MSDSSGDKTEKATPKRLEDARKKGQLPRSRELTTALVVLAVTAVVMVQGETVAQEGAALLAAYLRALPAALVTPGGGLELGVNDETNMRKFIAKRFDLLVSLDWAAAYNAKNAGIDPADLVPALVLDDSLNYWYGLNLSVDPDVAKRLNAALQKLRNDGRYTQLRQKYLLKAAK